MGTWSEFDGQWLIRFTDEISYTVEPDGSYYEVTNGHIVRHLGQEKTVDEAKAQVDELIRIGRWARKANGID